MKGKQFLALLLTCALTAFCGSLVGVRTLAPASAQTAPLGNGGPSVGCADGTLTCTGGYNVQVNLGNAFTWTAAHTFQNFLANTYVPTTGCATNAPTAPLCVGSPTSTIGIAVGKVSGGWGGTTSSNGGEIASCANVGSGDRCGGVWEDSSGRLILSSNGSGQVLISNSGSLNLSSQGLSSALFISQGATNDFGGSCTAAASTCTVTLVHSYTTGICFGNDQTTAAPVKAVESGASLTLTVGSPGGATDTLAGICFGNPS